MREDTPVSSKVLCDDSGKALQTAENSTVNHNRSMNGFVSAFISGSVLQIEAFGECEIQLDCGALERPAQSILDGDVNLRTVKSTIARVELPCSRVMFFQSLPELLRKDC